MSTIQELSAELQKAVEFKRCKPQFVTFSVTVAAVVARIMKDPSHKRGQLFVTSKNLRRITGYDTRLVYPDTPQSADFCNILMEASGIGAIQFGNGYWFFSMDRKTYGCTLSKEKLDNVLASFITVDPEVETLLDSLEESEDSTDW